MKAFIITRIGDVFMAIGLFLLYDQLGTLNIQELMTHAQTQWAIQQGISHPLAIFAALMLLGGAVGKSAQLPLQTWLPDAMAGPTPVSALIHAATMVTAGVYLIARTHTLFELAPQVQTLVGVIGAVTLLLAGFTALVQTDIKKILAYSTMSQIGYMFLALGASAWSAAIFHLMTHAFFKALLFLSAGAVIIACHHEQNIFKMGGLRKKIPLVYWCFIVGGSALAALPFLTAGFYSKDEILWLAFANGHENFFYAGLVGAFLTSLYTFRLIFIVFHGEEKTQAHALHGVSYWLPLSILLVLSTFVGGLFIHLPLHNVLPHPEIVQPESMEHKIALLSATVALLGIVMSWLLFGRTRQFAANVANSTSGGMVRALWFNAWGFDWLYDLLFVRPYLLLIYLNRRDRIDSLIGLIPRVMRLGHDVFSITQNGRLRFYVLSVAGGAVLILAAVLFL
jgi:NADH-quinone oxidoreductase subunit L